MPFGDHDFLDLVCRPAMVVAGGRIRAANTRLARLAGHSRAALSGMRARDLLVAEEQSARSRSMPGRGLAPGTHNGVLFTKAGGRVGARVVRRPLKSGLGPGGMLVVLDEAAADDSDPLEVERLLVPT